MRLLAHLGHLTPGSYPVGSPLAMLKTEGTAVFTPLSAVHTYFEVTASRKVTSSGDIDSSGRTLALIPVLEINQ